MTPIVSFIGYSGSGKTTYLEQIVAACKEKGCRVAVIKHDGHGFEMDTPGKDTWRYARAGADVVCIASAQKMALLRTWQQQLPLKDLLAQIPEVDIIFTEGYKQEGINKVAVLREANGLALPCPPEELMAVVTDVWLELGVPVFPLDDIAPMLAYLEARFMHSFTCGKGGTS